MMTTRMIQEAVSSDAELVSQALAGNRDAFGQIVSRYQSLICSLAYSAMGALGQSEDLAQETFITAWTHLGHLRERSKLRAWLCGIARNRINNTLRREGHEPLHAAEPLDTTAESPSGDLQPSEQAISREEEAILWRSLEKVPEIYREPLILFYREGQSVGRVAEELELSEDAVKQRLSRGRKLLQEQVQVFVEGALRRTSPGKVFTLGVLAALPLFTTSVKAATAGAAVAKGSAVAKAAATLGPAGGLLGMLGGGLISMRAGIENTKSSRERQFKVRMAWIGVAMALPLLALFWARLNAARDTFALELGIAALLLFMAVGSAVFINHTHRRQRQIQIDDGTCVESEWAAADKHREQPAGTVDKNPPGNVYVTAGQYLAVPLAWLTVLTVQATRAGRWPQALLMLAVSGLVFFLAVRLVRRWPRFCVPFVFGAYAPPFASLASVVAAFGIFTLVEFNLRRFFGGMNRSASDMITAHWSIGFNVSVLLAYAIFIWVLTLKGKTRLEA